MYIKLCIYTLTMILALRIVWFLIQTLYYRYRLSSEAFFANLFERTYEFNIVLVKLLQCTADNPVIWSPSNRDILQTYTDSVPHTPGDVNHEQLNTLRCRRVIIGPGMSPVPIHAGLISLVYKGIYKGKTVAVKMKRNDIVRRLERDMKDIACIVGFASCVPYVRKLGLAATYGVYGSVITEQTDFVCELRNQCKYAANFERSSSVTVPIPYPEVCTTECLVMDYVHGVRLDRLTRIQRERRMDAIADVMVASLLIHGFVHCDGHLGNCFAYPEDERRIAIIDFGICHQFSPREVDQLYEFLHAVAMKERESAGNCFLGHFTDYPHRSYPDSRLVKDLDNVFKTVFYVSGCFSVAEMSSLYAILSAHGISTVETWKKLEITLAALDSVFRQGAGSDTPLIRTILRKVKDMDRLLTV